MKRRPNSKRWPKYIFVWFLCHKEITKTHQRHLKNARTTENYNLSAVPVNMLAQWDSESVFAIFTQGVPK